MGEQIRVAGIHGNRRTKFARKRQLLIGQIDSDDFGSARRRRADQRIQPDAAQSQNGDPDASRHFGGVDHRTDACQYRATEHGSFGERQIAVDLDD